MKINFAGGELGLGVVVTATGLWPHVPNRVGIFGTHGHYKGSETWEDWTNKMILDPSWSLFCGDWLNLIEPPNSPKKKTETHFIWNKWILREFVPEGKPYIIQSGCAWLVAENPLVVPKLCHEKCHDHYVDHKPWKPVASYTFWSVFLWLFLWGYQSMNEVISLTYTWKRAITVIN